MFLLSIVFAVLITVLIFALKRWGHGRPVLQVLLIAAILFLVSVLAVAIYSWFSLPH